jgi:RNase P subunit RPR2
MSENTILIKEHVCARCHSLSIIDRDCVCTYQNGYATIELEFEKCLCCGNVSDQPADTEFNIKQYETLK